MKNKTKKKIKQSRENLKSFDGYETKLFGTGKVVAYEINGIVKSFCMTSEWPNGEGFDFSFTTEEEDRPKNISLHCDEIDVMMSCLEHLNYFNVETD